jgi:hypothetical protein
MRIQQVLAFIGAATLSVSAFADPSIAPSSTAAGTALARQGTYVPHLSVDDARRMRGAFSLADGRTITVTSRMAKLYVDIDGKREELVPVGPAKFVTRESGTTLAFNQVPFADEVVVNAAAR